MIHSGNAVRLSHRLMDGYVLSAEEALTSPLLPPYGYGCGEHCIAIPIPEATARRRGLTGASPTGTLSEYVRSRGGGAVPGLDPGFLPAFEGTDAQAQLSLLRQKVEEIRREDPADWSALSLWLAGLFGYDILRRDPEDLGSASEIET
jgi:hypothetical protein